MDDPAAVLRAPAAVPPPTRAAAAVVEATVRAPAAGAHSGAVASPTVAGAGGCGRQVFSVELRPGETTIVSSKKLLKEAGLGAALPSPRPVAPAVQPVVGPLAGPSGAVHPTENDPTDPSQSNRFNAIIEKIERLYMGKHSSDEEDLDDVPDDDQYDTEDSFIDDTELDEYFEVDNLATKHTGYFVNKGKLEQSEYGSVQNVEPKKRRRRISASSYVENNLEFAPGSMPVNSPKGSALQIGKSLASSNLSSYSEYHSEGNRPVKNKSNVPGRMQKMNSSNHATGAEYASQISSKDVLLPSSEIKDFDKHKTAAPQAVDFAHKFRTDETYDHPYPAYLDKDAMVQRDLQLKRNFNGAKQDLSNKMHRKEKYGVSQFCGLTTASNIYSTQTTDLAMDRRMEGSGTKAKGTRLEPAIRDLQRIVSEHRPQTLDVHDVDPNCQAAIKRRLPPEVKQTLAKVARLSVNQGKISEDELINRLMGIVGHLVQRRTLKKKTQKMAKGLSQNKNKVLDSLTGEDVSEIDPCYKDFLENLSEDGRTYVFDVPNGDHGIPASVRYEEDDMSYGNAKAKDSANVTHSLPHRSRGGPNVKRPGVTSGRAANINVGHSFLPRTSSVKKKTPAIDECYAAFLSLMKIKDGFMVIEPEPGVTVVYGQEEETTAGYDELRTVSSTKDREPLMNTLENMEGETAMLRDENRLGQTNNIISEHGIDGRASDNLDSQDLICTDEHGLVPYTEPSDLNACEDDQGAPLARSCGVPSTFDEKLDSVLSQPYDQNEYEELLRKATDRKPVSRQRHLRSVSKRYATGAIGLSYLDHYPDLAIQIDSADCDETRLSLLRKFFFWLENLCHEGAHIPWIPKALACDPIATDDYELEPEQTPLALEMPQDES